MDLPPYLLIAIDRGVGRPFQLTYNQTVAPGASVDVAVAPTTDALIWIIWKITWGNLAVGALNIRLDHGMLLPHTDADLTSRVAWEEALWVYAEKDKPLTVGLINPSATPQTIDFTVWAVQISSTSRSIVREWIYGAERLLECAAQGPCLWEILMKLLPPAREAEIVIPEPIERDAE